MSTFIRNISIILFVLLLNGLNKKQERGSELPSDGVLCNMEECVLREAQSPQKNFIDAYRRFRPQAESRTTLNLRESQYFKQIHFPGTVQHLSDNNGRYCSLFVAKMDYTLLGSPTDYFVFRLHRIIV